MNDEKTTTTNEAPAAPKLVITVRQLDRLETTAVRQSDGPF